MTVPAGLRAATERWITEDPDPATRAELRRVLDAALDGDPIAVADLADRMSGPLRFGTAGLRGPVRAGTAGMNVAVVRRATAGLAAWLSARGLDGGVVVVGRDARVGSEAFAAATAQVFAGAGFAVHTLPAPLPTPVLAFAVRELGAVAGVQITASHNPAGDNGYKVYLGDGAQLAPPADREVEAAIETVGPANTLPVSAAAVTVDPVPQYLRRVARLPRGRARRLRVALTPLHGVGGETAVRALHAAGFTDVQVVPEQAEPDPAFPTVASPNPEEPGATDAVLKLARAIEADLAIALDPDADRCAVGIVDPQRGWRMLSGDETGVLLGDHLLRHGGFTDPLVATTVVSSSMLQSIAAAYGARCVATPTGFKWIARAGPGLVYGYEEALGYCVDPAAVRDKDGIAAAVLFCDLAAELRARGATVTDRLDELAARHGVHLTDGIALRRDPGRDAVLARLREAPPAGWDVEWPAADVAVLRRPGERIAVRPSGTEPKLKIYLEVVEPPGRDVALARDAAARRLAALRTTVNALVEESEASWPAC